MSVIQQAQNMIAIFSIDFYGGWSIMDFFYLFLGLAFTAMVFNYFFEVAGKK